MKIQGKICLITGGALRIGRAIASALAERGAILHLHCHRSGAEGAELLRTLPGEGHRLFCSDLSLPGAAEKLFADSGRADILINNASIYSRTPFSLPESEARRFFEVNFWSPLALMRAFAGQELAEGAVVNILDQEVLHTVSSNGPYAWSRKALADATLEFARSCAERNLRFNAVCPGPALPPAGMENSLMKKVLQGVPLKRKVEVADLVSGVLFEIGNDSQTGVLLPVDCGQHLTERT